MASRKTSRPKKTARKTTARARTSSAKAKTGSAGLRLRGIAPSVTVDDVTKSLAWYCDVLGFTVKQRWENEGTLTGAELAAGDTTFYIGQDDWKKGRDRMKGQGVRIYFHAGTAKDVDRFAAAIKARGGTLLSEPKDAWGSRTFDLEDPTGYKITVMSV